MKLKDFLMTLNWFTKCDDAHGLAGTWGPSEEYVSRKVKQYGKRIQSLKDLKIKFKFQDDNHVVFVASLDAVNFLVQELRLDPSSKWCDPKSHSSGLVRTQSFKTFIFQMLALQ